MRRLVVILFLVAGFLGVFASKVKAIKCGCPNSCEAWACPDVYPPRYTCSAYTSSFRCANIKNEVGTSLCNWNGEPGNNGVCEGGIVCKIVGQLHDPDTECGGCSLSKRCVNNWDNDKLSWEMWSPNCTATGDGTDGTCSVSIPSGQTQTTVKVYRLAKRGDGASFQSFLRIIDKASNEIRGWSSLPIAGNVSNWTMWGYNEYDLTVECGKKYEIILTQHSEPCTTLDACGGYSGCTSNYKCLWGGASNCTQGNTCTAANCGAGRCQEGGVNIGSVQKLTFIPDSCPPPTSPKSCNITSINSVAPSGAAVTLTPQTLASITYTGTGAAGDRVRLWLERWPMGGIVPTPRNDGSWQAFGVTSYQIANCPVGSGSCTGNLSGLPMGNYYLHCEIPSDPKKCSGSPFCTYEGASGNAFPAPYNACTGWTSCSPTYDKVPFTVFVAPSCTITDTSPAVRLLIGETLTLAATVNLAGGAVINNVSWVPTPGLEIISQMGPAGYHQYSAVVRALAAGSPTVTVTAYLTAGLPCSATIPITVDPPVCDFTTAPYRTDPHEPISVSVGGAVSVQATPNIVPINTPIANSIWDLTSDQGVVHFPAESPHTVSGDSETIYGDGVGTATIDVTVNLQPAGTCSTNIPVTVTASPWWQVLKGDVTAAGGLVKSPVPSLSEYICKKSSPSNPDAGGVFSSETISYGLGKISEGGASPGYGLTNYTPRVSGVTYSALLNNVLKNGGLGTYQSLDAWFASSGDASKTSGNYEVQAYDDQASFTAALYAATNDNTDGVINVIIPRTSAIANVTVPSVNLRNNAKVIVFVKGNLTINSNVTVNPSQPSSIVFILDNVVPTSNGSLNVSYSVDRLDGLYIFPGTFNDSYGYTQQNQLNNRLLGRGSLIATGNYNLGGGFLRTYNSGGNAGTVWTYEPKYLVHYKNVLALPTYTWSEKLPSP